MVASYARPDNLPDALEALAGGRLCVAAGCTDLFPATDARCLGGPVLDITGLSELRGIARTESGLRIGAATTWTEIARAGLPPACRGLQLAAREVGALQIQNQGTIGGNLCNASPAADGVPPLLTLDARVELASVSGTRVLPLAEFITGPRRTQRRPDELLAAVLIPDAALAGVGGFHKLGARRYLVISIVMAAARFEMAGGRITRAALSVGSCGPVATRLTRVEETLAGQAPDPALIRAQDVAAALSPIDDVRADAGYRLAAATELLRRAVAACQRESEAA